MKHFKRANIYKNSTGTVTFDPTKFEAYSYKWWRFVERIGSLVVFNSYSYSNTTSGHQAKMRDLLNKLDIDVDVYVEAPKGLQDLKSAIKLYNYRIETLKAAIAKPRSRKATNIDRMAYIASYSLKIAQVQTLLTVQS